MPITESHPRGRDAALQAIALDESLGDAHRSLAAIIADHYWDWGVVERHYERAIALDPNDVTTLRFYSFYLAYTGRPAEALPIAEEARRLDPVSPNARMNLGATLLMAGRVDDAVRHSRRPSRLIRISAWPTSCSDSRTRVNGCPSARSRQRRRPAHWPAAVPTSLASMGTPWRWRAGGRALTTLDDLRRLAWPREPSPFPMAVVYVGLEDSDRAFEWLEKAFEQRSWELPMLKGASNFRCPASGSPVPRTARPPWSASLIPAALTKAVSHFDVALPLVGDAHQCPSAVPVDGELPRPGTGIHETEAGRAGCTFRSPNA